MDDQPNYRIEVGLGPRAEWTRLTIQDWGIWWRSVGQIIASERGATRPAFRDRVGAKLLRENSPEKSPR